MLSPPRAVGPSLAPLRRRVPLTTFGPAFVAAVAYIDPGNFATNITAGAHYGYTLVWVIVLANLMAMLVQYLSAKLGVATGRDLAELCRERMSVQVAAAMWMQAELVAMATDLAEFVGAAIGLHLLFNVSLPAAGLITAVVAFGILALGRRGHRPFELAIAGLFGIVFLGFGYDLARTGASPHDTAAGLLPSFGGSGGILLAVGIVGATVMPHVIYLHSSLTKTRAPYADEPERRSILRSQRLDVTLALGVASLINLAMLAMAAALLHHRSGGGNGDPILAAHADLGRLVGGGSALVFAVALLASGISSSSVGTYAGQVVMSGFIRRSLPLTLRRATTMAPALLVLTLHLPPTDSLIVSQVVLSFGIPFALIPLVLFTGNADVMGPFVNRRITTLAASSCAAVIAGLNAYLIVAELCS